MNRYVFAWGEVVSEKEVYSLMEEVSGEKLERKFVSFDSLDQSLKIIALMIG